MRKPLVKTLIGVALLVLIGGIFAGQKTEEATQSREFIVAVDDPLIESELHRLLEDLTIPVKPVRSLQDNRHLVEVKAADSDAEIVAKLERIPGIHTAERNNEYTAK
ncbi:MAG: hypothetical protein HOK54_17265 [Alphaproteobacteria bacterium]|jgi:hypothetical protein|nr:hypothetical protein [Alphaproteobacteria bacterium]